MRELMRRDELIEVESYGFKFEGRGTLGRCHGGGI
jgi:hypothetical protein